MAASKGWSAVESGIYIVKVTDASSTFNWTTAKAGEGKNTISLVYKKIDSKNLEKEFEKYNVTVMSYRWQPGCEAEVIRSRDGKSKPEKEKVIHFIDPCQVSILNQDFQGKWIWMDQFCINQSSREHKEEQLGFMRSIYTHAPEFAILGVSAASYSLLSALRSNGIMTSGLSDWTYMSRMWTFQETTNMNSFENYFVTLDLLTVTSYYLFYALEKKKLKEVEDMLSDSLWEECFPKSALRCAQGKFKPGVAYRGNPNKRRIPRKVVTMMKPAVFELLKAEASGYIPENATYTFLGNAKSETTTLQGIDQNLANHLDFMLLVLKGETDILASLCSSVFLRDATMPKDVLYAICQIGMDEILPYDDVFGALKMYQAKFPQLYNVGAMKDIPVPVHFCPNAVKGGADPALVGAAYHQFRNEYGRSSTYDVKLLEEGYDVGIIENEWGFRALVAHPTFIHDVLGGGHLTTMSGDVLHVFEIGDSSKGWHVLCEIKEGQLNYAALGLWDVRSFGTQQGFVATSSATYQDWLVKVRQANFDLSNHKDKEYKTLQGIVVD
mmetsp:Transcript_10037/g.12046  ORF Transcript_10037/g.12046 Transcript_10037/m.12046 type:complete len:553 (+) Transcript_10037:122-1780(+)